MASAPDRLRDLKAFDDTKAGVKGLVDAGVTAVPTIFHHPPESLPAPHDSRYDFAIPVIDLAGIATPSRRAELVGEVKAAAETAGFFQVVNHGVPEAAMSEMLAAVRRFHESPAEAKRPYYTRQPRRVRYQCNFDLFQSPAANWRDTLYIGAPHAGQAPEEEVPAACRAAVAEYTRLVVEKLGGALLELLSEALGLRRGYLADEGCLAGPDVVAHYYPACPQPRLTLGVTRHTDPSFFTVLLQDGVGGLQVLLPGGGGWADVPAVAGALVVNVGNFLQLLSNDRFRSVEHRVLSKSVGPRVSAACFFRTHGEAASAKVYAPIVRDGDAPRYRSATVEEMVRHHEDRGLDGTSALARFRL